MLEKTKGIVLKSYKYSESSLISKIFTEKFGVLSFIVPGVRSSKNKRGNMLQTGQLLAIDLYYRENKNFQRFKEYKVAYIPLSTFSDIKKMAMQSFIMELSIQLVKEGEENEELYAHLESSIIAIDQQAINGNFPINNLLAIAQILGFYPANNYSDTNQYFNLQDGSFQALETFAHHILSEKESYLLHELLTKSRPLKATERKQIFQLLLQYYKLHIPNFRSLQSIEIISEVLKEAK